MEAKDGTEVGTDVACNTKRGNVKGARSRAFIITVNNYTEHDLTTLLKEDYQYMVYQIERGHEDGTVHIQAGVYYTNPRSWDAVKKRNPRAHIEVARSADAVFNYCMKEDTRVAGPYEFGTKPEQGRRHDLEHIGQSILEGITPEDIAIEHPMQYIRYFKGMHQLQKVIREKDRPKGQLEVTWLYGAAGTGKTRFAVEEDQDNHYIKDNTKWWDGYQQEKVVIIDDFSEGCWNFRNLLRLLDKWYPYSGEFKGGYMKISATKIYITCEFAPEQIWQANDYDQVRRRLDRVIRMGGCPNPPMFDGDINSNEIKQYHEEHVRYMRDKL